MKNSIPYCILALFVFSQQVNAQKTTSSQNRKFFCLNIILDSSFMHRLCDSAVLTCGDQRFRSHWVYERSDRSYHYQWTNLPAGQYSFTFQTFFKYSQRVSFKLNKDSSFSISNSMGMENIRITNKQDMLAADSIHILYKTSGCFGGHLERNVLVPQGPSHYKLIHRYDSTAIQSTEGLHMVIHIPVERTAIVSSSIVDSLFVLMDSSTNKKERIMRSGNLRVCTTRKELYVLTGNKLYSFSDYGIHDWELYEAFRKRYVP